MILNIKVGSITNAQRTRSLLNAYGYKSQIKKIENPMPGDGCGYAVTVSGDYDNIVKLLQGHSITVRGVEIL